jgi:8-oxo-dGTP pyrophosphatase MutT (NUDIX family)
LLLLANKPQFVDNRGVNTIENPILEPETPDKRRFKPRVTVATIVAHPSDAALPLAARRFLFVEEWIGSERRLNQPAGHLDPNESLAAAAVRETLEETAWDIQLEHLVAVYQYQTAERAFVRFTYTARALQHTSGKLDEGIIQALWLTRSELIAHASPMRSPMVLQGLDLYLAGARHPLAVLQVVNL